MVRPPRPYGDLLTELPPRSVLRPLLRPAPRESRRSRYSRHLTKSAPDASAESEPRAMFGDLGSRLPSETRPECAPGNHYCRQSRDLSGVGCETWGVVRSSRRPLRVDPHSPLKAGRSLLRTVPRHPCAPPLETPVVCGFRDPGSGALSYTAVRPRVPHRG